MILKKLLPVIAILMVVCIVAPGYIQAAEYVDRTLNLEIESKYQNEHDEVVNVANESSIQNPDTWDPAPQGIWIGSSTEESLFKFDAVATENNRLQVGSTVRFNRTQIMNGGSEFIVRSPISAKGVLTQTLGIIQFSGNASYALEARTSTDFTDGTYVAFITVNMTDTSITTGEDCWTLNDRTYVLVRCPIYSGYDYAFIWTATYDVDESFTVYVSGQDIVNDNLMETQVSYYTNPEPDVYNEMVHSFAVDPGISFDFLTGLGNGVYANSFYMHAGDTIQFTVTNDYIPEAYHTIMVPFGTDDGTLNATVTVERWSLGALVPFWSNGSRVWNDYILACSDSNITGGDWSPLLVTITVNEEERVNWIFADAPSGTPLDYAYDYATLSLEGIDHTVYARPWHSYQPSIYQVFAPSMNPGDFPDWMAPEPASEATWYGTIIGVCLVIIGGTMVATGFLAPVGAIVAGIGTGMIIGDIARGGHLIEGGTLPGFLENALDAIRDAFEAFGQFLISIGEGLWDALCWLADAIVEYGAFILGLLMIAVGIFIFFKAMKYQLEFWDMMWAMASGDWKGAAKAANGLDRDISRAMRTVSKVDKRVSRAGKVLGKKWASFNENASGGQEGVKGPKRW